MGKIADRAEAIRARLVKQAADPIDMGDYKDQMRAYQELLNDTLKAVRDLAYEVEKESDNA